MLEEKDTSVDTGKMRVPAGYTKGTSAHTGPILGILIIILVVILGGLYLWGSVLSTNNNADKNPIVNNEPETPRADADADILGTVSTSDELDAIDADLSSTNLESLTTDLTTMNAEIDAIYAE